MIQIPQTAQPAPFRVTRASHLTFTVSDLARSRDFYTEVVGLVVSDEDRDTIYLRGVEERSHHSLILKRTDGAPSCIRTGLRTYDDEDLEKAKFFFDKRGIKAEFVDAPFQSRTLHASDISGTPLEFCATMPRLERLDQKFESVRGGGALRFDHYQVTAPDVQLAASFYADFGFRILDYMIVGDQPVGVFLHAKDSQYDVVLIKRPGPALHHFAYVVHGIHEIMRACDVAGSLGFGDNVEFGPGRHSLGHSYYVYLVDPDGHRVELLPPPIYSGDAQDEPIVHDLTNIKRVTESWGLPPRLTWLKNASSFHGVERRNPPPGGPEPSLEAYLGMS
ncbi:VOC family protein [Pararobbsia alpina]|uniref:Manganese-dependent 2,3-dihydroxybiphenyl 1,2-dioxygenase n=1 Tax=Pararobbsia alpina TaxID=621374 RepID=A0A6S7D5X2_9BURK|nr:VOC family protein [Pararobbsia alpina]CAB3807734.1 Manganese-dependent 2,3-dihydroxybiphenyl 1,2-dioxygenase [Pararobbsia alpina]